MSMMQELKPTEIAASLKVYLSHSATETYLTCGRKYKYGYVDRFSTLTSSCALGFGNAVHEGCAAYLISTVTGLASDPVAVFLKAWEHFCTTKIVNYGSQWSKEKLTETGIALIQAFVAFWPTSGYTVVVDAKGEPVVERRLKVNLPGGVVYTAVMDVVVMDQQGRIIVIDLKTPAQLSIEGFASVNEQLLGYQIVIDAYAEELGIERVDGMAFIELHKVTVKKVPKKAGAKQPMQPSIAPVEVAERRPDSDVREWIEERMAIAEDIRKKRFPKRPGDSFSSPCKMCDFSGACLSSDYSGLYVRKKRDFGGRVAIPISTTDSNVIPF